MDYNYYNCYNNNDGGVSYNTNQNGGVYGVAIIPFPSIFVNKKRHVLACGLKA